MGRPGFCPRAAWQGRQQFLDGLLHTIFRTRGAWYFLLEVMRPVRPDAELKLEQQLVGCNRIHILGADLALPDIHGTATLSDFRVGHHPDDDIGGATSAIPGSPPITQITFPACRAHYPGGPNRCLSVSSLFARPSPVTIATLAQLGSARIRLVVRSRSRTHRSVSARCSRNRQT